MIHLSRQKEELEALHLDHRAQIEKLSQPQVCPLALCDWLPFLVTNFICIHLSYGFSAGILRHELSCAETIWCMSTCLDGPWWLMTERSAAAACPAKLCLVTVKQSGAFFAAMLVHNHAIIRLSAQPLASFRLRWTESTEQQRGSCSMLRWPWHTSTVLSQMHRHKCILPTREARYGPLHPKPSYPQ